MGSLTGATGGSGKVMGISDVTWRTSSYSGANGGECVEISVWRKASRSGDNGGACVEVASAANALVAVRDSKDPDGPALRFPPATWRTFIERAASGTWSVG